VTMDQKKQRAPDLHGSLLHACLRGLRLKKLVVLVVTERVDRSLDRVRCMN
jgi:hypothetical protein